MYLWSGGARDHYASEISYQKWSLKENQQLPTSKQDQSILSKPRSHSKKVGMSQVLCAVCVCALIQLSVGYGIEVPHFTF